MTTIKDISKAAGVSVTTVSRALNGHSDVSVKTKKRIQKIANELNYAPNAMARSLVMKRSKTIGLLVSEISREGAKDNFTFEVLCGINDRSAELEYDIILFNTNSAQQRVKSYMQLCKERKVDGVIIQGLKLDDPYLEEIVESGIPCVVIDIPVLGEKVGYVTTDNVEGARNAVQFLIEYGHRNIAFMNGHSKADVSKTRKRGFELALTQNGMNPRDDWQLDGQFSEQLAEEIALEFLPNNKEVTAIFCASDLMALGVMKASKKLNIRVPDDLSIIGYDDIIISEYSSPSLTTISQDKYRMGYEAAELLVHLLEGQAIAKQRILKNKLIIRESTINIKKE